MRVIQFIWVATVLLSPAVFGDTTFTPQQYLQQVQQNSPGLQGALLQQEASNELVDEASHYYAPEFFSTYDYVYDKRPTLVPAFQGDKTILNDFTAGVKKLTDFGLTGSVFYNIDESHVYGVDPLLYPSPHLYVNSLNFEVSQSFLRNGFGRGFNANVKAQEAKNIATMYEQKFLTKQISANAEFRYWELSIARNLVQVRQNSLDRTKTFQKLNQKRARLNLIDKADLLAINAAVQQRELELKNSIETEKVASRDFNTLRNQNSDQVPESLALPTPELINQIILPKKSAMRDDLKAAQANIEVAKQNAVYQRDQRLPLLDAKAAFSTNGLDPQFPDSANQTFDTNQPMVSVGVALSVPLDFVRNNSVRRSYTKQIQGAQQSYQQTQLEQETSWNVLRQQWDQAKERLGLAMSLRDTQSSKLDEQRRMQQSGKSTTYQVFLFEQDLLDAELLILQTEELALNIYSQMKTYEE